MKKKELVMNILSKGGIASAKIVVQYVMDIIEYEIPDSEQAIREMDKEEMKKAIQKLNTLGSAFGEPVASETLENLHKQTLSLWGTPPQTPEGEWAEWCLWHHKRRYEQNDWVGEAPESEERPDAARERIEAYLQDRTDLWKRRTAESSDEYDSPEDVPDRLRDLIFNPGSSD